MHYILPVPLKHQPRSPIIHPAYPGVIDNVEYPHVTMYFQHLFYPEIKPILNDTKNGIKGFNLQGFHHDQYGALEKAGLFTYINPIYGDAAYGAEECIGAYLDFGYGIIPKEFKTFFPQSWSREKVTQVIFEAAQNIIKILDGEQKHQIKFLCKGQDNLLIEIMINTKNVIVTAYPSRDNFKGLKI